MKKVFALIAVCAMMSCQTDETTPKSENKTTAQSLRVYYDNGGDDYGCRGSGGNCLDDVVIVVIKKPKFSLMANVISSGNQNQTATYFRENQSFLSEFIGTEYIDGTIRGTYTVSGKGDINTKYYVFFTNTSTRSVDAVYPLVN